MNSFANAVALGNTSNVAYTNNGMLTNASSLNPVVDLFFAIGSSRGRDITGLFTQAYNFDPVRAVKVLFWARDVRGGAGERGTFRSLMLSLEQMDPDRAMRLIPLVSEYGRFDDLLVFQTPAVQAVALETYVQALRAGNGLAAKWSPRRGPVANQLRKALGLDPKSYRQLVVSLTQVVESQMCAKEWSEINYEHVPSVAAGRYQKAFKKRDGERYGLYKEAAVRGEAKINASASYPYDVLKSLRYGDQEASQAQWNALPNYLGDGGILPMVDVSSSMSCQVGGQKGVGMTCMDMSVALGLYIADRQVGAFRDMFLTFATDTRIEQLKGTLTEKVAQLRGANWGGCTSLETAFREVLKVAVVHRVPQAEMPRYLVVLSDMEFNQHSGGNVTAWQMAQEMFERAGYERPKVIWWNLNARPGNVPVTQHESGAALVSGYNPSIMKSVLGAREFTPVMVMEEAINSPRYQAVEAEMAHQAV